MYFLLKPIMIKIRINPIMEMNRIDEEYVMNIGIDKIGFYTPPFYVDMNELAKVRGDEPAKYTVGIGQDEMSVAPLTQDIVSMAANAALQMLDDEDRKAIDLIIIGTESGFDASKSAAVYMTDLLGLFSQTRCMEIKHACYGATAGIQMAKGHIALNPKKKALVIGSDIARYGLATGGEVTQGAGAVAMVISANPRILSMDKESAYSSKDIMDFWRPAYSEYAMVDGQFSNEQYIAFFLTVWNQYKEITGRSLDDMDAICFHLPFTKMGLKALREVLSETNEEKQEELTAEYKVSTTFNRKVGNIYTGSLYLNFLSLLVNSEKQKAGNRIGMYSYGSGAVGEFFSGTLVEGYEKMLPKEEIDQLFADREKISVEKYEELFSQTLPQDGSTFIVENEGDRSAIRLGGIKEHKRFYMMS